MADSADIAGADGRDGPPPDFEVGFGRPPAAGRFRKRQSGNPKGRPRGRGDGLPHAAVLGRLVTVRENGANRRMTAAEAFLLHLTKQGLDGDGGAARAALTAITQARASRLAPAAEQIRLIERVLVAPGCVNPALELARMGSTLDRYRPSARMVIAPWLVQAALARLGDRRLTPAEQQVVMAATRTPHRVRWPDWWAKR